MKHILYILLFTNILLADAFSINKNDIQRIKNLYNKTQTINRIYNFKMFFEKAVDFNEIKKLNRVNYYINRIIGKSDETNEWITPKEFLIRGRGDCEDYCLTKYFALKKLNMDINRIYPSVVKVRGSKGYHMVLLYKKDNNFLVLDNLSWKMLPLEKRTNLEFYYAFNEKGSYIMKNNKLIKEKGIRRGEVKCFNKMINDIKEGN